MDSKLHNQLEEAKIHFHSGCLLESYHILRRYFDRLPFQPEEGHAEYIGMFIRTLFELGKEFELKFYLGELERAYGQSRNLHIGYTLGMVYFCHSEPRMEAARVIFENIVRLNPPSDLRKKAKIMLANYYDTVKEDTPTVRLIIDSIDTCEDPMLQLTLESWKAKVLGDEVRFMEAEAVYQVLLDRLSSTSTWYIYWYTLWDYARLKVMQNRLAEASELLERIKILIGDRCFKHLMHKISFLEARIERTPSSHVLYLSSENDGLTISFVNRKMKLKRKSSFEKLLMLFDDNRCANKDDIVRSLYERDYAGEKDDKLIYYHIHCLRKKLKELGLPSQAIEISGAGYRLVPRLERMQEEV